jgi:hypothetical protein
MSHTISSEHGMLTEMQFTWAISGGLWLKFSDGHHSWYTFDQARRLGLTDEQRLHAIEKAGYGWQAVRGGAA